jgi:UDP-2,4-diacetamido-2,4,6-trideoxy-beta-L-altropyranose hydrolase
MKKHVVFRADGSDVIGFGHVYRLLALAEMLNESFECIFVTKEAPEVLVKQMKTYCKEVKLMSAENETDELRQLTGLLNKEDIVVLDGYGFSEFYQKAIKTIGNALVCIDDTADKYFYADAVINHAEGVKEDEYRRTSQTKLFLGVKYALLRKDFLQAAKVERTPMNPDTVFISFGGTDLLNLPLTALTVCEKYDFIRNIHLIMPGKSANTGEIEKFMSTSRKKISAWKNLSAEEMISVMKECGLAIVSASTISYEISSMKMGMIAVQTADNQKNLAGFLQSNGLAQVIQFSEETISEELSRNLEKFFNNSLAASQMESQQYFFDGRSSERINSIFENLSHA